jgi:hypothetical protein
MLVASPAILDPVETAAESLRGQLGVDTLSVSILRVGAGDLRTLVNVGVLGPGEQRRPAAECYPLRRFPDAAALVVERRPFVSAPGAPGCPASVALEARIEKTSQAAAPVLIEDRVWGELWVASTANGLPLSPSEMPLICWAAARLGEVLAELLEDGADLDPVSADPLRVPRRYEIWIEGHISPFLAALIAAPARRCSRYTIFEAALDQPDLYELLSRLNELALPLVAVRPAQPEPPSPERIPSRGRFEHTYQLRLGGHVNAERIRTYLACTVEHHAGYAVVTTRLDQTALGGLLHMLERLGADLLSLRRAP